MYTPHRPINTWRGDASAIAITRRGLFFFSFSIPRDKRSRTWFVSTPSPRYSTATRQTIANDAFLTRVWNKCAVCPEFVVTREKKKDLSLVARRISTKLYAGVSCAPHRLIINWRECTNHARPITVTSLLFASIHTDTRINAHRQTNTAISTLLWVQASTHQLDCSTSTSSLF